LPFGFRRGSNPADGDPAKAKRRLGVGGAGSRLRAGLEPEANKAAAVVTDSWREHKRPAHMREHGGRCRLASGGDRTPPTGTQPKRSDGWASVGRGRKYVADSEQSEPVSLVINDHRCSQ
jgi:hypothetical protein